MQRALMSCCHPADRQSHDKKRDQAVEQQSLARMAISHVRPDERQHEHRGCAIEVMHRRGRTGPLQEEQDPKYNLHGDQSLADDQGSRQAAGERFTLKKAQQSPQTDRQHEQEDRGRQAVMDQQQRGQRCLLRVQECDRPDGPAGRDGITKSIAKRLRRPAANRADTPKLSALPERN